MVVSLHVVLTSIKVGAFSFGGGYTVLVLIQKGMMKVNQWIEAEEFVNIVAVAGMTPGLIVVNSSTYVGFKPYDPGTGILLTLCVVLIPFILALLISYYFQKFKDSENLNLALTGTRPAVVGIIATACFSIGKISITRVHNLIFFLLALFAVMKLRTHPILALVGAGVSGVVYYLYLLPLS